jgi:hypothetical protein
VLGELGNLGLHALQHVADLLGSGELLRQRAQDEALGELSAHEHLVVARALRSTQAAVVATALAADLGDRGAAGAALHGSR